MPGKLLLFAWAGTILVPPSSSGSRMEHYTRAWRWRCSSGSRSRTPKRRTRLRRLGGSWAAPRSVFAIGGGAFVLSLLPQSPPAADITTHLRTHATPTSIGMLMARVLDLTAQALSDLRAPSARFGNLAGRRVSARPAAPETRAPRGLDEHAGSRHGGGLFAASNLAYVALEPSRSSRALSRWRSTRPWVPMTRSCSYGDIRVAPGVAFALQSPRPPVCRRRQQPHVRLSLRRRTEDVSVRPRIPRALERTAARPPVRRGTTRRTRRGAPQSARNSGSDRNVFGASP